MGKDGKLSKSVHENLVANDDAPNFGESADAFAYNHAKNNEDMGIFVDQNENDGTENASLNESVTKETLQKKH